LGPSEDTVKKIVVMSILIVSANALIGGEPTKTGTLIFKNNTNHPVTIQPLQKSGSLDKQLSIPRNASKTFPNAEEGAMFKLWIGSGNPSLKFTIMIPEFPVTITITDDIVPTGTDQARYLLRLQNEEKRALLNILEKTELPHGI
jgi:hypothetical protein